MSLCVQRGHHLACDDDFPNKGTDSDRYKCQHWQESSNHGWSVGGPWSNVSVATYHGIGKGGTLKVQRSGKLTISKFWGHNSFSWRSPCARNKLHAILLWPSWMYVTHRCPSEDLVMESLATYRSCTEASKPSPYKWSFCRKCCHTHASSNIETCHTSQPTQHGSSDPLVDKMWRKMWRCHTSGSYYCSWPCVSCCWWHTGNDQVLWCQCYSLQVQEVWMPQR